MEDCASPRPFERHVREAAGERRTCVLRALGGVVVDVDVETVTWWIPVDELMGMLVVRAPD